MTARLWLLPAGRVADVGRQIRSLAWSGIDDDGLSWLRGGPPGGGLPVQDVLHLARPGAGGMSAEAWPAWSAPTVLTLPRVGRVLVTGMLAPALRKAWQDAPCGSGRSILAPVLCRLGADPMQAWRSERTVASGGGLLMCQGHSLSLQAAERVLQGCQWEG